MVDMNGTEPPQELAGHPKMKSETKPKQQVQATAKRGSVLKAVEDIQRMTPEAIVQEFDRMIDHTQQHFRDETFKPCVSVADELILCLRRNKQQSYMCFGIMEQYRHCVGLATQAYVDRMAEQEERRQREAEQLPVMPPQNVPAPTRLDEVRSKRSWLKPWTWLR